MGNRIRIIFYLLFAVIMLAAFKDELLRDSMDFLMLFLVAPVLIYLFVKYIFPKKN